MATPSYPLKGKSLLRLIRQQVVKIYDEMTITGARMFILDTIRKQKTSVSPDYFIWWKTSRYPLSSKLWWASGMDGEAAAKTNVFVHSRDQTPTSGRSDRPTDRRRRRLFKVYEFYHLAAEVPYTNSRVNVQTTLYACARWKLAQPDVKPPGDVGLGTESEPLSRDGLSGLVVAIMGVIYPLHRKL